MINELTKDQEKLLEEYRNICDKLIDPILTPSEIRAEKEINKIFEYLGHEKPVIVWIQKSDIVDEIERNFGFKHIIGKNDANYLGFRKYFVDVLKYDIGEAEKLLDASWNLIHYCNLAIATLDNKMVLCC